MQILGVGNKTYLYVNGIKTNHEITLSDNVSLLPVTAEFDYSIASRLITSDIDYSIVVLSASSLFAQLRISADSEKDLAIIAWNSLWDCLLIGATINSSVVSNLQCDKPVESMKDSSYLHVTNYELRGVKGDFKELTPEEEAWLESYYRNAKQLLEDKKYETAVHCMSTYLWHSVPRVQLSILWAGIESLFNVNSEVSFRISLYIANFLCDNNIEKAQELFKKVKKLYDARSSAVHGNKLKGNTEDYVSETALLLKSIIKVC